MPMKHAQKEHSALIGYIQASEKKGPEGLGAGGCSSARLMVWDVVLIFLGIVIGKYYWIHRTGPPILPMDYFVP